MKSRVSLNKRGGAVVLLLAFVLVFSFAHVPISFAAPPDAPDVVPTCSWILETAGRGATNFAYPDTDATYWTMPLDTTKWKGMIVDGKFPESRFFSFSTYIADGDVVDSIQDVDIDPKSGSTNPFRRGPQGNKHKYRVTISKDPPSPGERNHIMLGDTDLAWVIYRIYVSDKGLDNQAGVPLPRVTLVALDGTEHPIPVCPFTRPAVQLAFLVLSLEANGFTAEAELIQTLYTQGNDDGLPADTDCQPPNDVVFWIPENTGGLFPNEANKYIAAPGLCFIPGHVLVVRGKGAVFPDTYNGGTIYDPAIPGRIKMRYWSMCNNNQVKPFPVVQCEPDALTPLDENRFYTYVIGEGANPPAGLDPDLTWLPWGLRQKPNILIFRNMLPKPNFPRSVQAAIAANCAVYNESGVTPPRPAVIVGGQCAHQVMGAFYPRAVYCDRQILLNRGWQACFADATVSAE
jgi:hypothetical protein